MHNLKAVSLLILAGLLWSLNGVVIKAIAWHPVSIAGGLCFFAALLQILYLHRLPQVSGRVPWLGVALYGANTLLFVSAMQLTTVTVTLLLQSAAPVYVAILGRATLGEPARVKDWISVVLIFVGTYVLFSDELTAPQWLGTCLAAFSGVSNAGYSICLRKQKNSDPLDTVVLGGLFSFLLSLPVLVREPMTVGNVSLVALLGILLYGVAFIAFCEAMKHVRAIEALILGNLELIFGPVWAYLLFREQPGPHALCGGAIIFSVVILYSLSVIRESGNERLISKAAS